jgi:hypothetical protein
LRYISSTSHSFCPNGELMLLTAAVRLDSHVLRGGGVRSAVGGIAAP